MTLRVRNLQVDLGPEHHDAGLAWWATALGGTPRAVEGPYTHLDGVRSPVGVHVQRLEDGPGGYHLDLEADDVEAEVARLLAAGATRLGVAEDGEERAVVLRDPAGLPFCVTDLGQAQELVAERTARVRLQVLMFDVVGQAAADAEAAFWAEALGGEARPVGEAYPEYQWVAGVEGPGGSMPVAVQTTQEGTARLHVDLHCPTVADRDDEVARLTAAGAQVVAASKHWRVLRSPGGPLACVVPDAAD